MRKFIKSIYLGDRLCNGIRFNFLNNEFVVEVDLISRVRSADGQWDFYSSEDICKGELVFLETTHVWMSEEGKLPNDQINYLIMDDSFGKPVFILSVDSIQLDGMSSEVIIKIEAKSLAIRDPAFPDNLIIN